MNHDDWVGKALSPDVVISTLNKSKMMEIWNFFKTFNPYPSPQYVHIVCERPMRFLRLRLLLLRVFFIIDHINCRGNTENEHFSTFSNWTPCIYFVYGILYTLKKEKKIRRKKCSIFCGSDRIRAHDLRASASLSQTPSKTLQILSSIECA